MWCKVGCMSDRDDFAELVGGARSVTKCPSFYFNGRIRYGTKGEKVEERLLCMDAIKVYICSVKTPVKIESQFNILSIKLIERVADSQVLIETDEKQTHSLYGLHDKSSLQPFLVILLRNLHAVYPHRVQAIVEIRPENEYEKLLRSSNDYGHDVDTPASDLRPCGGFSLRYECACDFYQVTCNKAVQGVVDTVFAHRTSREFTFREFEPLTQKDWLPIISALRHNEWFTKLTIQDIKLASESIDELCTVTRLCKTIRDLRLINCGLRPDFCTRFAHAIPITHVEHVDLSNNALEDKGLIALSAALPQRKSPLVAINLQSCSLTYKSLQAFNTALVNNSHVLASLRSLNLAGNRVKEENCLTILFQNPENVLEDLFLSDLEFSVESFFQSLSTASCKLRRLFITSAKSSLPSTVTGGVKAFFTKNHTLEVVQISNASLTNEFLKELCDGLHANVHLNKLDLRLCGNPMEPFVHEYAARFAAIPSLTALDVSGCDLDNEIPTLLSELKKNRKLKSLYLGRNFNNIKQKNMQRTISAMKELVVDGNLENLSIADSKLKENIVEFLLALTNNASLKTLDIRGNLIGDTGARVVTHILQMNRHLHTILFDRNLLTLNNFEDIVDAMQENYTIQYLPIPITDLILMKISEKDRMEKVQLLMSKLDGICTRNQQQKDSYTADNALLLSTAANLTREVNSAWENQQQLIGSQASLDYVSSCSTRLNNGHHPTATNSELISVLTRTANINKISAQLHQSYLDEEERLKEEWKDICQTFKQKCLEKNERLSRKFYQLFKEQTTINYDDKLQEQVRTCFADANDSVEHLLNTEMPARLSKQSRECYINVASCLQKRAYETTNESIVDMQRKMETDMFRSNHPQPAALLGEGQQPTTTTSTLERNTGRVNNVVLRSTSRPNPPPVEALDETPNQRQLKPTESTECVTDSSPKLVPSTLRAANDTEHRPLLAAQTNKGPLPVSPKPSTPAWRKSMVVKPTEPEPIVATPDPIYGNVHMPQRLKSKESSVEDEGDLIEHDLLDLVEQEQQKEQLKEIPPALPAKTRAAVAASTPAPTAQENSLDVDIEPAMKLVHPGKDRPRPPNARRPAKKAANGAANDSSSDGGLLTDDNDDLSATDVPAPSASEPLMSSSGDSETSVAPVVTKFLKSALKTTKPTNDECTPLPNVHKLPTPQPRPPALNIMSKSMTLTNKDSPQIINSDPLSNGSSQVKSSMSTSLYSPSTSDQKDVNHSIESIPSSLPSVSARTGKLGIGTRVLPMADSNVDAPPIKLRHFQPEKKAPAVVSPPPAEATASLETSASSSTDVPAVLSSPSATHTDDQNEQYKRLPVKERARMLSTTLTAMTPSDKKPLTSTNATSSF